MVRNSEWASKSSIKHSRILPFQLQYLNPPKEHSKISMSFRRISVIARLRCWLRKSRVLKERIGLPLVTQIMGRISKACAVRSLIGLRNHQKKEEESRMQDMMITLLSSTSRGEISKLSLTATLWAQTGPLPRMLLLTNLQKSSCLKANLEVEQMECTRPGAHWVWIRGEARNSLDLWTTSNQSGAITLITDYVYVYTFYM